MGSPAIWVGNSVKILKSIFDINGNAQILSGTTDPSSVATSAPKGSLYLNTSSGITYQKQDAGSSTNWTALSAGGSAPNSYSFADSPNGYGSTNTAIRRFTNQTTVGSDITYADSATLGATWTINTAGNYAMVYTDRLTTGGWSMYISKNQSTGLTGFPSTAAEILGNDDGTTSNYQQVTAIAHLAVNDVIRAGSTPQNDATGIRGQFRIVRMS